MREAIDNVRQFLSGKTEMDFLQNKMLYFAVVKNMEIIGEAAYMLTRNFTDTHPLTSWRDIIRMRHILVHGYYQIEASIVWESIESDLPLLHCQIEQYIEELSRD